MRTQPLRLAAALALTLPAALAVPASASAGGTSPVFTTTKLAGSTGTSEPRAAVTPNGMRWIDTNDTSGNEVVYGSPNGLTWTQTATMPGNQTLTTTDVDIIATPTGRLVATELDYAGINFRTAYSDDGGATWTDSIGTEFADTDRPWLASGPVDPATGQPRVYLLFHNLLSGTLQHNMFVSTSTDGGATFGAPIPITAPPSTAYLDLQCADSGGPSNLFTDSTGRVYAVFGTRDSAAGGCAAQPTEVNVVAADRVWVVEAPAAGTTDPTQWTAHLAVNHSTDHHIVGMQLAPGAVDSAGNVYVAFPESQNPYPDYSGGAIEVVRASAGHLDTWSAPSYVAPFSEPGNLLPHIVAGDPGRVAVSYTAGIPGVGSASPTWVQMAATSTNALDAHPTWSATQVSPVVTETGTASSLMGACNTGQTATLNGFACGRATDVNGIALDKNGNVVLTWPAQAGLPTDATYASQQVGGPSLFTPVGADLPESPWVPASLLSAVAAVAVVVLSRRRRANAGL